MSGLIHKCSKCGYEVHGACPHEPQSIITVRLPKRLHEALKAAAHEREVSLNQFCVEMLGHFADCEAGESEAAHA